MTYNHLEKGGAYEASGVTHSFPFDLGGRPLRVHH